MIREEKQGSAPRLFPDLRKARDVLCERGRVSRPSLMAVLRIDAPSIFLARVARAFAYPSSFNVARLEWFLGMQDFVANEVPVSA